MVVNASCVDNRVLAAVMEQNESCFEPCQRVVRHNSTSTTNNSTVVDGLWGARAESVAAPAPTAYNQSSMCFLTCVYATMFGSPDGTVFNKDDAMPAELLVDRWVSAFADDDTGCPRV